MTTVGFADEELVERESTAAKAPEPSTPFDFPVPSETSTGILEPVVSLCDKVQLPSLFGHRTTMSASLAEAENQCRRSRGCRGPTHAIAVPSPNPTQPNPLIAVSFEMEISAVVLLATTVTV